MSRRGRIRRQWTHRRLGLGAAVAADAAMLRTDALLTAVGARRTTNGSTAAGFEAALLEFVCDLDAISGLATVDASPIPLAALRTRISPPKPRRMSWRVLVPAASSGLAAVVIAVTLLLAGGSSPALTPAQSASTESKALLNHAGLLLSAAQTAPTTERPTLVAEAKADLSHVSRLVALAPGPEQPGIRAQIELLNNRASPLSPPARGSAPGGGSRPGGPAGTATAPAIQHSGAGTSPVRRQPISRRSPTPSGGGTGPTTSGGGGGSPPQGSPSRPPGTATSSPPASRTSGTAAAPQPRPGSNQAPPSDGGAQSGSYQPPPPPAGGRPRG